MTRADKVRLKIADKTKRESEIRERTSTILERDALTPEIRAERETLTAEYRAIQGEIRELNSELMAAIIVGDKETDAIRAEHDGAPDAEQRERIELRGRARLSNYLLAAANGRRVDGAEAELCSAARVSGIPLELLDVPGAERRSAGGETRAVTPSPATVGVNLDPIRPAVFAQSIAARLGVEMPRVESGTFATATITGSAVPAALDKGGETMATAGALTVTTAKPKRVSARLELALEDIAAIGQANFESILRQNLTLALADSLDSQMINGNGAAPNLAGFFNALDAATAPSAAIETFDTFVAEFAGGVDGLWANMASEIGIVVGPATYRLALQTFRDGTGGNANRGEIAFADYAMAKYGGFWTNKRMPDAAANIQEGILYRGGRNAMGADAGMRTAVCAHWGEVTIDDIYTRSSFAERVYTMHVLLGDVILVQKDAYKRVAYRTAV